MDSVERMMHRLEAGSATFNCSGYIGALDPFIRTNIYTSIFFERLKRKSNYIIELYNNKEQNWEQVFYILLLRFLGTPTNTEPFVKLAHTVSFQVLRKYLSSSVSAEALLLGTSGLLDIYPKDDYTFKLWDQFLYLSQKHGIGKMSADEWNISSNYPYNHPVLRISQAISILSQQDFGIESIIGCKTGHDTERLFSHEASQYWTTHFVPTIESADKVKRIGKAKADILAINIVAPFQFAYGSYIDSDRLRDRALNLLESIPAERNFKVRRWSDCGLIPKSAFDSQVLIQLGDEYCLKKRCRECPVGQQLIKSLKETCKLKENK